MAQPPRPSGPPGAPGAPGMPPGPPGAPGMPPGAPGMRGMSQGGYQQGSLVGSYEQSPGDKSRKGKKGKKRRDDDSSDEEEECKCPPPQPSTQIYICPPSCQPPGMGMGMMGGGQGGMGFGQECGGGAGGMGYSPLQQQSQGFVDPAKLCQIQCFGGGKSEDTQTQVICCPPSSCNGCQKKSQQRAKSQCECCGQECPPKKGKKAQAGNTESMMPASQQFLMFLQAYGLAAALIRDRNRREEERQQKEFEEKQKGSPSESKERKGSAKGKDKGKEKGKKKG